MNNNDNNKHNNKFFDGFIWGLIIGGALVFLIGTKKGKKLLKTISEEGVGSLSDILEENIDTEDEFEEEEEAGNSNGISDEKAINEVKPSIRKRFFRKRSS